MLLPILAIAVALLSVWVVTLAIASYLQAPRTAKPISPTSGRQVSLFSLILFLFAPFSLIPLTSGSELETSTREFYERSARSR
ncbi:hypothetical protein H6F90_10505 [Trichocoleus sp. FACHB-591]|uniref:hypothetical protein n=1 Tax=Trichocoleus sp. FACHB-591 TaxID=2692872 RepID=UPI0016845353|nr:hypothetical protein [Trichocoleus sp. FACHB-591]MBD2095588.1 hypothetical protein [Trichocoleus sp. FACHB-591]